MSENEGTDEDKIIGQLSHSGAFNTGGDLEFVKQAVLNDYIVRCPEGHDGYFILETLEMIQSRLSKARMESLVAKDMEGEI